MHAYPLRSHGLPVFKALQSNCNIIKAKPFWNNSKYQRFRSGTYACSNEIWIAVVFNVVWLVLMLYSFNPYCVDRRRYFVSFWKTFRIPVCCCCCYIIIDLWTFFLLNLFVCSYWYLPFASLSIYLLLFITSLIRVIHSYANVSLLLYSRFRQFWLYNVLPHQRRALYLSAFHFRKPPGT